MGSIPESERSASEGNGNPVHYFCLGKSIDRGACQAIVHGVAYGTAFLQRIALSRTLHSTLLSSGLIIYLHYAQFCSRRITISCKKYNKLSERILLRVPLLYSQVNFYCPLSFISNMNHSALLASNPHAC